MVQVFGSEKQPLVSLLMPTIDDCCLACPHLFTLCQIYLLLFYVVNHVTVWLYNMGVLLVHLCCYLLVPLVPSREKIERVEIYSLFLMLFVLLCF